MKYKRRKTTTQKRKKNKESKKKEATLGQFQELQHSHHEGAREEREQEIGNLFKKMTETFPNFVKEIDIHVQKCRDPQTRLTQRGPYQDTSQ